MLFSAQTTKGAVCVVDFAKRNEWKAMGKQLVALTSESYRSISTGGVKCLHCGMCSPSDKDIEPLFIMHREDCEVGKAQELIAEVRKRVKEAAIKEEKRLRAIYENPKDVDICSD